MKRLNLKAIPNATKTTFTLYVYNEVVDELKNMANETGFKLQDLIRHSINEMIDTYNKQKDKK